eukprot:GFYU01001802.1.p1 GENE.GFYU01001802.1~~GFYU01001802.1.p1  ORF type:complete len:299 (-),score=80.52 GFYU01001802.1:51-947(-)
MSVTVTRDTFTTGRGITLRTVSYLPKDTEPRAVVGFFHGYNSHYESEGNVTLGHRYAKAGFAAYSFDWEGHGLSPGKKGYIPKNLDLFVDDARDYVRHAHKLYPDVPVFISGESMSGLICTLLGVRLRGDKDMRDVFKGAALFAPAFGSDIIPPKVMVWILLCLNSCMPTAPLGPPMDLSLVWHPERGAKAQAEAERRNKAGEAYGGAMRLGTAAAMFNAQQWVTQNFDQVDFPFIVLHGTEDHVCTMAGSQALYDESATAKEDKEIQKLDGLWHDLLQESDRDVIIGNVIEWMEARL